MLRRLLILAAIIILSSLIGGGIYRYGCINRVVERDVLAEAKQAYLYGLIGRKRATAGDLTFVKCGPPAEIADYFYGIPVGTQWCVFCAHIKEENILASEEFRMMSQGVV
ncbi:hypothetical protein PMI09_01738 [Rhizobium sp. CF122]|uniref:hypothetical protein n=1 Tax=Rhizobium sp. CF122 TaxID=1144312 RepID=UPI00027174E4|nr:hypothetical protein [Rhizobium sp. CF122]EJL56622.1 hypothetical protein PMI09_01738 [Rhizobium sp. CF122]